MNNSIAPSVHSILNSPESFLIPVYQRSYVWTEYNWKTLWQDLVAVAEDERKHHFIGSIILSEDEAFERDNEQTSSRKEWLVIDGQQRLTTLTLLIAAACHWLADQDGEDIKFKFKKFKEDYLFKKTNEHGETKQTLRLKPSTANEDFFNRLLDPLKEDKRNKIDFPKRESRIYAAFNYFYERIEEYSKDCGQIKPERVVNLIENGLEGMQMVRIELDKEDDPQRIFDSINHLGFRLSESDLIRNYILQGLPNRDKRREFHDEYWSRIEKAATDQSVTKEAYKDKVPDFFRHYLTMKLGKAVNEQGEKGVYETFRDDKQLPELKFKTKGKTDIDDCKKVLCEILRYAGYYEKSLNPQTEKDAEIRKQLEYVRHMPQAGVLQPFLLQVFDDYENRKIIGKPTLVNVLELIQSYVVRCVFAKRGRQGYNKLWAGLYRQSFKAELDEKTGNVRKDITDKEYIVCIQRGLGKRVPNETFPVREDVEEGIKKLPVYKSNSNFTKYILLRLEEKLRGKKPETMPNEQKLTIEHIYPQKAGTNWVGFGSSKISDDEHKIIKREYLHTLGNLTLTAYNLEMSNKTYLEKVKIGYEQSGLRLNDRLNRSIKKWDTKRIAERAEELSELFFKIWEDIPQKCRGSVEIEAKPILDVEFLTDEGKPLPIKSALFGSIEIPYLKKKGHLVWFLKDELVPEKTSEGRFYNEIMNAISEGHEGSLEAIGLGAEIVLDENGEEIAVFIVPWELQEGEGNNDGKYRVRIKYDEMLANLQKAAKATDTAGKLKIMFAE